MADLKKRKKIRVAEWIQNVHQRAFILVLAPLAQLGVDNFLALLPAAASVVVSVFHRIGS